MITQTRSQVDSPPSENAPLTTEDTSWLDGVTALLRSHVSFLLADARADTDLVTHAAKVMAWKEGRFVTIRELVDACASHRWNVMIYEAWASETAQRIRALIRSLDATAAQAAEIYARQLGYFDVDASEAQEALHEAQRALYGDPYDV